MKKAQLVTLLCIAVLILSLFLPYATEEAEAYDHLSEQELLAEYGTDRAGLKNLSIVEMVARSVVRYQHGTEPLWISIFLAALAALPVGLTLLFVLLKKPKAAAGALTPLYAVLAIQLFFAKYLFTLEGRSHSIGFWLFLISMLAAHVCTYWMRHEQEQTNAEKDVPEPV